MASNGGNCSGKKRFVVLDRDGTIIEEHNHLSDLEKVELLPETPAGLRRMMSMGLGLAVATNQSGIGRGYFDLDLLSQIHDKVRTLLAEEKVQLDGIYFCPHTPDQSCACRKPGPGMVEAAARDHGFDPKCSFVIGDRETDIELGNNIGATTFLVTTGYGAHVLSAGLASPDYVVSGLAEAASVIESLLISHRPV